MAGVRFVHGFKAAAERTALELRKEIGIGVRSSLDPHALAVHLSIPVVALESLRFAQRADIDHFLRGGGRSDFSAATIFVGRFKRIILYNTGHSDGRQMSSLCHELGHVILGHETEGPVSRDGQRDWDARQEAEADWLGGSLLIPAESAFACARAGASDEEVAELFGVSVQMAAMRMNVTGARVRARRASNRPSRFGR